jgi:hypothetical protein
MTNRDVRHCIKTYQGLLPDQEEPGGAEVIMSSVGDVEVRLDGEVVGHGRLLVNVEDIELDYVADDDEPYLGYVCDADTSDGCEGVSMTGQTFREPETAAEWRCAHAAEAAVCDLLRAERAILRTERDAAVARAEKAEAELQEAKADARLILSAFVGANAEGVIEYRMTDADRDAIDALIGTIWETLEDSLLVAAIRRVASISTQDEAWNLDAKHSDDCSWHHDWHRCSCGLFDDLSYSDTPSGAHMTHPYAIVAPDSAEHADLLKLGWTETDRKPDGWCHMEPPFRAKNLLSAEQAEGESR